MNTRQELIEAFMDVFEKMIVKLEETDSACIQLTQSSDVTRQELSLIGFIGRSREVIMRQVAEYMEVPYSTATGIVDKLSQRKFLKRINSSTDRRTVKVCLTPGKGQKLYESFVKMRYEMGAQMLSLLDDEDLKNVERIIKKFTANLPEKLHVRQEQIV